MGLHFVVESCGTLLDGKMSQLLVAKSGLVDYTVTGFTMQLKMFYYFSYFIFVMQYVSNKVGS